MKTFDVTAICQAVVLSNIRTTHRAPRSSADRPLIAVASECTPMNAHIPFDSKNDSDYMMTLPTSRHRAPKPTPAARPGEPWRTSNQAATAARPAFCRLRLRCLRRLV